MFWFWVLWGVDGWRLLVYPLTFEIDYYFLRWWKIKHLGVLLVRLLTCDFLDYTRLLLSLHWPFCFEVRCFNSWTKRCEYYFMYTLKVCGYLICLFDLVVMLCYWEKIRYLILSVLCLFQGPERLHASSRRSHICWCPQKTQEWGVRPLVSIGCWERVHILN